MAPWDFVIFELKSWKVGEHPLLHQTKEIWDFAIFAFSW